MAVLAVNGRHGNRFRLRGAVALQKFTRAAGGNRMRNICSAIGALVLAALLGTTPAAAQDYEARLPQARREMNRAPEAERFTLASRHCLNAIEGRTSDWMKAWCNLAVEQALRLRERQERNSFTEAEQDLLIAAAWVNAVDGLPELTYGEFRHPIETVALGGEADTLRASAYRVLADIRSHRNAEIWRSFQAMMRHLQLPWRRDDTMRSARRRLLDRILAEPHTPEQLWAAAAIALTSEYEFPAGQTLDRLRSESAELVPLIAPLRQEAAALTGRDAALGPLLTYAHAALLHQSDQRAEGSRIFAEGRDQCFERLWRSADLCMELDYRSVLSGHLAQDAIDNPELAALTYPPRIAGRMRGVAYTEERCRVITVADINDMGVLENARVIYRLGPSTCLEIAQAYTETLRYPTIAQAQAEHRRQGIVVNFQLRSE